MMRVAVIGGGINGFCCAIQILEHYKQLTDLEVTVISETLSPNTTGDGSAGLWGPYLLGGTSKTKVYQWAKKTHDFLEQLWRSEDAGEAGICLIPVVHLATTDAPLDDFWKDVVYGCQQLSRKQLDEYNRGRAGKFTSGLHFVTFTSEPIKLLPYLMKRFKAQGGKIMQEKVNDFEKFVRSRPYDVVINCTGLGSKEMLGDQSMFSVRGQVSRVKANWLYCVLIDFSDDGNYIIPNSSSVVLGGTHQESNYDGSVSTDDRKFIVEGCRKFVPALVHAEHLFDWVGLRPGRDTLRLELWKLPDAENKIVIHNYGHGGSGVTLAWGCAQDVLAILDKEVSIRKLIKSKL